MKISKYTKIIPKGNVFIVLSLASGSVLMLDKEKGESLVNGEFSQLSQEDIEFLIDRLILIQQEGDDFDYYYARDQIKRYTDKNIHCVLIPTYACNFDCPYCYQHNLFEQLNAKAAGEQWFHDLLAFFKNEIYKKRSIHIEWFGGEPTLYLNQIAAFNYKIRSMCEEEECSATMSMITNGYLLSPPNADKLVKSGVKSFMITLDGLEETHNSRRYLRGGGATYKQLLHNISYLSSIAKVNVRLNLDTQTVDEVVKMYCEIESSSKVPENISVVIAPVFGSKSHGESEFYEIVSEIFDRLKASRLNYDIRSVFLASSKCKAGDLGHYVIDGTYNVYKCVSMAGNPDCADGTLNVEMNRIEYNDRAIRFLSYSNTRDLKCIQCEYLPVCGNICPVKQYKNLRTGAEELYTNCGTDGTSCKKTIEKKIQAFINHISDNV